MSRRRRYRPRSPSATMLAALRRALWLEKHGPQGEPWVTHPSWIVLAACQRQGLAELYRVHPGGAPYYRITPAGRDAVLAGP